MMWSTKAFHREAASRNRSCWLSSRCWPPASLRARRQRPRHRVRAASAPDAGGLLGGLGGLLEKLQQGGLGDVAKSWVGTGQNQPISPGSLGSALGPSLIKTLAEKTGLSEQKVAAQLSQALPGFVDKLTPQGRLPAHEELNRLVSRVPQTAFEAFVTRRWAAYFTCVRPETHSGRSGRSSLRPFRSQRIARRRSIVRRRRVSRHLGGDLRDRLSRQ